MLIDFEELRPVAMRSDELIEVWDGDFGEHTRRVVRERGRWPEHSRRWRVKNAFNCYSSNPSLITGCATSKGNQRHAQHAADQIKMVAVQREQN